MLLPRGWVMSWRGLSISGGEKWWGPSLAARGGARTQNRLIPASEEGSSVWLKSPIFKICCSFTIHLQWRQAGGDCLNSGETDKP